MASNNHKRRRSHLATPVEQSTSSATASPPKRSRSDSTSIQKQKPLDICGLGLKKIKRTKANGASSSKQKQSKSKLGPMIHLCPKMYLGRTPPYLSMISKSTKSLDMTHETFHNFCQKHSMAQKHALMGLDRTKNASKKENEGIMSVSRMLLQIVDSSSQSLTLKRCPEVRKPDGREARQVPVKVHRNSQKNSGIENEVNGSSESTTMSSSSSSKDRISVDPDATVTLREGDCLTILNENYCYKVVRNPTSAEASAPKRSVLSDVGTSLAGAIDLVQSSSSSSSNSSGMEMIQERSSIAVNSLGRQSLSSLNDRTIVLNDDDAMFEQDTRAAIKLSLQSPKQPRTPISKTQEIITIDDDNEERPNNEPVLSKDYKFETPNCKPSASKTDPEALPTNDAKSSVKTETNNDAAAAKATNEPNTMKNTESTANPIAASATTKQVTTRQQTKKITKSEQLRINLRQKGLRIRSVMLQEMDETGNVVEKPLHEILSAAKNKSKRQRSKTNKSTPIDGPILSLESPTKRFWDTSWGCDTNAAITVTPIPAETKENATDSTPSSFPPLPHPTDTPASMGVFYWNALQSARPREGAWFVNASIVAANTVPGPALCQKWMDLLTWGCQKVTQSKKVRVFAWDGPKMEYAMSLWKTAIGLHPQILLPRMVCAAPGGLYEWWKTCLAYDDILEDEQRRNQLHETGFAAAATIQPHDSARRIIHCLRMRSARLECLHQLLHANLKFETEHYEKLQIETEQAKSNVPAPMEDDSSSDEEDVPNKHLKSPNREKALMLLQEIRACGTKPVLRLVAQAMSKFWVAQRNYLGYTSHLEGDYTLEQERSELVQEVAERYSQLLETLLQILAHKSRSRRKCHKEAMDILWNAMDMELGADGPSRKRTKADPSHDFLVEWVWSLQESVGTEFAQELATKIGIRRQHMEDLWEL